MASSDLYYCSSLTSITIPNSVTEIGGTAFSNCTKLTSVTIPNSVTVIGYGAFYGCSSLTAVIIPNSVTEISGLFEGCSLLTSVTIPNSVTEIGRSTFSGCSSLPTVDIPNSVTKIGDRAFEDCSSLTCISIPDLVTEIDNYVFSGCTSLTSVTIGNSVNKIGEKAFYNCRNLKELTLPESVSEIGSKAVDGAGLTELTVLNPIPPTVDDYYVFSNPENIALYVPEGSIDFYRLREPWSRFKSINAVDTAIEGVEVEADVAVSVCGAEIVAPEGSVIFDLKGRAMRATKLPVGVYIVRTPSGKTVKVTIAL
ncbi:MAG: leucine-rich repeat domain-containing protein [Muribaculaceae bacterium]|nr:leucine-rich repeat domain-containing protein [Muribaculaceae bacterium]